MTEETKKCPYCAETIQAEAIICRYCNRPLGDMAGIGEARSQTIQVIGFGRRLVAYLVDAIILAIVGGIMGGGVGFISTILFGAGEDTLIGANFLAQCLGFIVGVSYFVGFWTATGQTLGKMAMGIKVISVDGSPVTFGKAIVRYIGYIISGLVVSLGFIWIGFDAKRQGWHDKMAGTYVVRKDTTFSGNTSVTIVPSDAGRGGVWIIIVGILVILMPIMLTAILLLLGPVVGDVFSGVAEGLQ